MRAASDPGARAAGFDRLLGIAAAAALFFIMALTCVDVGGRYFLDAPVPGGFEITELAMGALIFTGLPLATLRGQQVTVDLFDSALPRALRSARDALMHLLSAACLAVVAWRLWIKAGQMLASGDTTATLHIPVPPLVYYMSLQAARTALVLLALAFARERPRPA
ncbi:MAG: hypothetical protein Fur0039_27270 [Rhodocyclaceae bacterium]